LEVDFVDFMQATASGTLDSVDVSFTPGAAACVVMASAGYPGAYEKGKTITGVENVSDALVFEAGTRRNGAELQTNGGRVLAVTGQGASLQQALDRTYAGIDAIHFDGAYVRRDIGQKGL
ncbi:MAG: phosphoribosylglycinamide synthetase C domain-containing protein, partial [Bacteroidota bacterium]